MNQKRTTPDEKFLIKLYEIALSRGSPLHAVSVKKVSEAARQKDSEVKNIVKLLAAANFIKKIDDHSICLTPHGVNFVLEHIKKP